jgi:hypothetical protein
VWDTIVFGDLPTGTTSTTVAVGNHTHAGVYEPVDTNILRQANIGVSVQAYDVDLEAIRQLVATDDYIIVASSANQWARVLLPDCTGAGKAVTYDRATNTFGCNTVSGSGAGTPGGSTTQVQINDVGGVFGGDPEFTYNKTTNVLTVAGGIIAPSMTAPGGTAFYLEGAEQAKPQPPEFGIGCWADSTDHQMECQNTAGVVIGQMLAPGLHNFLTSLTGPVQTQLDSKAASNSSTAVNGVTCQLGSSCTVTAVPTPPSTTVLGGVKSGQCPTITDKLMGFDTNGDRICEPDQNTGQGGGSGIGRTSAVLTFASAIPDGGWAEQTFTWTGITTADTVVIGPPSTLTSGLDVSARVSAANTVAVRLFNSSGASVTPGSATYKAVLAVYNLNGSSALDFGSIPDGGYACLTFTLTGALAGDPVVLGPPAALENGLNSFAYVSAADTIKVCNKNFSGAAIDPASATYTATIAK